MDGDTISVAYRRQIEAAVMIGTRRSGRRDVFAEIILPEAPVSQNFLSRKTVDPGDADECGHDRGREKSGADR